MNPEPYDRKLDDMATAISEQELRELEVMSHTQDLLRKAMNKPSHRVYEIIQDGKHLHKYSIRRNGGSYLGEMIAESPERLCELYHWDIKEFTFEEEPFSMWDIGDAVPVRKSQ